MSLLPLTLCHVLSMQDFDVDGIFNFVLPFIILSLLSSLCLINYVLHRIKHVVLSLINHVLHCIKHVVLSLFDKVIQLVAKNAASSRMFGIGIGEGASTALLKVL